MRNFNRRAWSSDSSSESWPAPLRWAIPVAILVSVTAITLVTIFIVLFRMPANIYQLGAAVGPFVEGIVENGRYGAEGSDGMLFFASKLPVLPTFYAGLFVVTGSTIAALIVKNVVLSTTLAAFLFRYANELGIWRPALALSLVLAFCIPFNAMTMQALGYEEALLGFIVPIAIGLAILSPAPWRSVALALLITTIYLTKSSMVLLCFWLALMAALEFRKLTMWQRFLPGVALLAAALAWGGFVDNRTGQFAIGSHASSNNGWNLYKGNNSQFEELYPARHLDELSAEFRAAAPDFDNEWAAHEYYSALARTFMQENPDQVLRNAIKKLHVLLVRIPGFEFDRNRLSKILVHDSGMIVNRILLWSAIVLSLLWLVRPGEAPVRRRAGFLFLGALAAVMAPYVVGFGYQRHMVPVFISSILIIMLHDAFSRTRREARLPPVVAN